MKSILAVIVLVLSVTMAFGQKSDYPKGVYMSFDEIKQKTPSVSVELEIERRTKGEIKMNGGNDYKLYTSDKSIRKKIIKKEYYGYSDGDSLYINCIHYDIQPWYATVLSDGKFLVIRGGISMIPKTQKAQLDNQAQLGYMFGAIGGAIQGAKLAMLRFIYVIDKESNQITTVSSDYLRKLLSETPELLEQFEAEEEQANQKIFVKYLGLLNEKN
ncbi:MAG: hypothetical protein RIG62_29685 [Cyclobacteriaceae bacterium]